MISNFYCVNFQPDHADMDPAGGIQNMPCEIAFHNGGDQFFALRFRDALCVRQPGGAKPAGEFLGCLETHVFDSQPDAA